MRYSRRLLLAVLGAAITLLAATIALQPSFGPAQWWRHRATHTPTVTLTALPTSSPTATTKPTEMPSPTLSATATLAPTSTWTVTLLPTASAIPTETETPTPTVVATVTPAPTVTPSITPTTIPSNSPSASPTSPVSVGPRGPVGPLVATLCPTGSVSVAPGQFSQAFVAGYAPATVFCLRAGVHHLAALVNARDGDSYIGEYGAILDGQGTNGTALSNGPWPYAQNVTVSGITFQGFTAYVVGVGRSWTVTHNEVNGGVRGIAAYAGSTISYNYVHNAKTYGISAFQGSNTLPTITISDNVIAFNGGTPDSGGSSGGTKFSHTTTLLNHNDVHDNTGDPYSTAALWCDYDNLCTFTNNRVTHNGGMGVHQEMDFLAGNSGSISGNYLQDNCQLFIGKSIGYCSDLQVRDSNNVAVSGNTIVETTSVNPLGIVRDSRVSAISGVAVHDNIVTFGPGGQVGFDGVGDLSSNHFDDDAYNARGLLTPFTVGGPGMSWVSWQAAGQDQHGTFVP